MVEESFFLVFGLFCGGFFLLYCLGNELLFCVVCVNRAYIWCIAF